MLKGYAWEDYGLNFNILSGYMFPNAWMQSALVRSIGERYLTVDTENIPLFSINTKDMYDFIFGQFVPWSCTATGYIHPLECFMKRIDEAIKYLYPLYLNLHKYPNGLLPIGEQTYDLKHEDIQWNANSMYHYLYGRDLPKQYIMSYVEKESITIDDIPEWSLDYYIRFAGESSQVKVSDLLYLISIDDSSAKGKTFGDVYAKIYEIITPKVNNELGCKYSSDNMLMYPKYFYLWASERIQIINALTHYIVNSTLVSSGTDPVIQCKQVQYAWEDIQEQPNKYTISNPINQSYFSDTFGLLTGAKKADTYSTLLVLSSGRQSFSWFKPTLYYYTARDTGQSLPEDNKIRAVWGRKQGFSLIVDTSTEGVYKEYDPEYGSYYYGFSATNPTKFGSTVIKAILPKDILINKNVADEWENATISSRYLILNFITEPNTESTYSSGFKFRNLSYNQFEEYDMLKEINYE